MGQRLIVNIKNNGTVLANAYYHWSAYSTSSLATVLPIMAKLNKDENIEPTVEYAIELLRTTGADVTKRELELIKEEYPDLKKIKSYDDRNEGLISITEKEIEESIYYGEGTIDFNLEDKTFSYGVLYEITAEEYKEDYGKELNKEELIKLNLNLDKIPIEKLEDLVLTVRMSNMSGDPFISGGRLYCIIS